MFRNIIIFVFLTTIAIGVLGQNDEVCSTVCLDQYCYIEQDGLIKCYDNEKSQKVICSEACKDQYCHITKTKEVKCIEKKSKSNSKDTISTGTHVFTVRRENTIANAGDNNLQKQCGIFSFSCK